MLAFSLACRLQALPHYKPMTQRLCRLNLEDMLKIPWHVAIFDEAHKLKNSKAKIHTAASALKTKLRYGLTGTAMQVCPSLCSSCCTL